MPFYLLLPLASAIIYALGSLLVKRALKEGVTMDQSFHLTNIAVALIFLPLLVFETMEIDWAMVWEPILVGLVFFIGNWLSFVGIKRGDVSLVTPLMGTKVVFVAVGVVVLTGQMPSTALWIASILTALGIFVMRIADLRTGKRLAFTILVTLASAAMFGINDVLVGHWASGFGGPTFLVISAVAVAAFSGVMWLGQGRPSLALSGSRRFWAWFAAIAIGLQAIGMGIALGFFDDATGINVVYASRGLWVIVIVVWLGALIGNSEHKDSGKAFLWRIAGTIILTVAIVIAVIDRSKAATALEL